VAMAVCEDLKGKTALALRVIDQSEKRVLDGLSVIECQLYDLSEAQPGGFQRRPVLCFQARQTGGLAGNGLPDLPELFHGGTGFDLLGYPAMQLMCNDSM